MIENKHLKAAFEEYIESRNVRGDAAFWASLNVNLVSGFGQYIFEEYGITVDMNRDLEFYAKYIEDDQAATMFKLRYG